MLPGAKRNDAGVGTRRRLLETLKSQGPKTARELSLILGGGPVAMRVHLRNLLAAGFVSHVEEHQPVGRPVRRYSLTAEADALFAKHYDDFALKLLDTLVARQGSEALMTLLSGWEEDWARELVQALPANGARLPALAARLTALGAMASVRDEPDGAALTLRNCTIAQVAWRFPVICEREAAVLARVLGRKVALAACQARGGAVCAFHVAGCGEGRVADAHADDAPRPAARVAPVA
jgi:predicted ArsR family transcriptional regulator